MALCSANFSRVRVSLGGGDFHLPRQMTETSNVFDFFDMSATFLTLCAPDLSIWLMYFNYCATQPLLLTYVSDSQRLRSG